MYGAYYLIDKWGLALVFLSFWVVMIQLVCMLGLWLLWVRYFILMSEPYEKELYFMVKRFLEPCDWFRVVYYTLRYKCMDWVSLEIQITWKLVSMKFIRGACNPTVTGAKSETYNKLQRV